MKIAFVGTFGDESVNGVEYACYLIARYLKNDGHDVLFLYQDRENNAFIDQWKIEHKVFKKNLPFYKHLTLKDYLTYNPDGIDIFHLHSVFIPFNYYVSKVLTKKKQPYIITPHGGYMPAALSRSKRSSKLIKLLYTHIFEKQMIQRAEALVATTTAEIQDFRNFGFAGTVHTIPNPLPIPYKIGQIQKGVTVPTLLYLGRFDEHFKGLFFLIDTFEILLKARPNAQLKLYGEGDDEQKLINYIKARGLRNVEIKLPVFGAHKEDVINKCSCYFQPSRWESFGMSALEAMSLGKPLILTETCYLSELLARKKVGRVVPLNPQKAANIINDYLEFLSLPNNEGELLKKVAWSEFAPKKIVAKTIALYSEIVSNQENKPELQII